MMSAFVFVQIEKVASRDDMNALHDALHAVDGVKTVHFVTGPTDVIAFIDAEDQSGLMEAVGAIRGVSGVASTDTRIVIPM
jgi:hypothetical protein